MIYFKFIFVSDLERITSYADICIMKTQTPSLAVSNGVAVTASVSATSTSSAPQKKRKITLAKFVARLNKCPMTAKGFNKRAESMAKGITISLVNRYRYATTGNRVTAANVADFVQDGMLSILKSKKVDMTAFTYDGQPMTQGQFFNLWARAAFQQINRNDQFARIRKEGEVVNKIVVASIATTNSDGVESISNEVEIKALEKGASDSTTYAPIKKMERKMIAFFNEAKSKADKKFWYNAIKMIRIETSQLPAREACKLFGFEASAYYVMKKRLIEDDRMRVFGRLRALGEF